MMRVPVIDIIFFSFLQLGIDCNRMAFTIPSTRRSLVVLEGPIHGYMISIQCTSGTFTVLDSIVSGA